MRSHRPLFTIAVALSFGILLAQYLSLSFKTFFGTTILCLLLGFLTSRNKNISCFFVLVGWLFLGGALSINYQYLPKNHVYPIAKYYRKQPVSIEGIITSDVRSQKFFKGRKTIFELDVKRFKTKWGWRKKTGKILVNIFRKIDVSYGDYVILEGKLHHPFSFSGDDKFSYRDYLYRKNIRLILSVSKKRQVETLKSDQGFFLKAWSMNIKKRLARVLSDNLTANEAGIMGAIVLGDRSHIPKHIREIFIQTGTAHILAISGLHTGIIASLVFLFLKVLSLPRKAQFILTILFLIFYAFLTGGRPSVVRATIMAGIFLSGFLLERETDAINSLSLAAILLLIFNPLNLFDVGFQLSFISVFSIVFFYPKVFKMVTKKYSVPTKNKTAMFLVRSLIVSFSAWLGVAGLIAYYFDIITPITVFANLIIIPLISVIVALGLGLLFIGVLLPDFAFIFAACIQLVLNGTVGLTYLLSHLPGAYLSVQNVSLWHASGYYVIIFAFPYAIAWAMKLTKLLKYATLNRMKKDIFILVLLSTFLFSAGESYAFWVWTPETNKWVNPKHAVKDTPKKQLAYALESYKVQDYKKATIELQKLIKNYPKAREAAEAQYYISVCLEEQGDLIAAFHAYQKVIQKYPFSERSVPIVKRQYEIGERLLEGEGKRNKIIAVIVGGDYDVIEVFRMVIKNAPYGSYAPVAQYKIGLYLLEKGMYQEARDAFEKVVNDYPDSEWIEAAKYQIAFADAQRSSDSEYDQKITQAAVEQFQEFVKVYPDAELSENARVKIKELKEKEAENNFLIARFYEKQNKFESAKIYYNTVLDEYQNSQAAVKALERLREMELKDK